MAAVKKSRLVSVERACTFKSYFIEFPKNVASEAGKMGCIRIESIGMG